VPRSVAALRPFVWGVVASILVAITIGSALVVFGRDSGPEPPFLAPGRHARPHRPSPRPPGEIWLAGSGSNLPLIRELVAAFQASHPAARIVVHPSIGSGGGARATRDGAVDLGLVSRALSPAERGGDLVVIPYARSAVVVAASPGVADTDLRSRDLVAIYDGARMRWRDGARILVLQREQGDSGHQAVSRRVPGFAEVNERAWRESRWRVLYSDRAMQEALLAADDAIGLFDLAAITVERLPLRVLQIDGVAPSPETVASGAYPFVKDLAFVSRGAPHGLAAAFVAFVRSEQGRAVTRGAACLPLPEAP